ncbi:MAG: hypothetical protein IT317_14935 [Anaerolineales bacterium]|nr:hypothetical protein [Anaerolineales bacterium]
MSPKLGSCLAYLAGYTILAIIVIAITVGVAVGLGSLVGVIAPNLGVAVIGPLLCPPDTTPTLVTEYGAIYRDSDNNERQDVNQFIRCDTAQGDVLKGRGDQYELFWFGSWVTLVVGLEALAVAAWLLLKLIARLRQGNLPQPAAGA